MDNLTTTLSPLVIDVALAILILLVAVIKAKAGIYQSVMAVVVVVLALAIGFLGAKLLQEPVSEYAWSKYGPKVEAKFDEEVQAAVTEGKSLSKVFEDSWNDLIKSFAEAFNSDNLNRLTIKESDIDYSDSESIQKVKVYTLAKAKLLCDKVCLVALFGLLTAIALLALTIIKNVIGEVADFSVIGWANHLLGFLFGAVEMIVILLVIIRGSSLLGITFFQNISEGTVLLNWLIGGDIQSALQILQNFTFEDIKNIDIKNLTTIDFKSVGDQVELLLKEMNLTDVTETVKEVVETVK